MGSNELDDPNTSFPNNVGPATRMGGTDRQLTLDLGDIESTEYLDWVIGHYGSADDGLRAIRLQAVGNERALNGAISRWTAIETLFDASEAGAVPDSASPAADDTVVAPEPAVALRRLRSPTDHGSRAAASSSTTTCARRAASSMPSPHASSRTVGLLLSKASSWLALHGVGERSAAPIPVLELMTRRSA